MTTQYLIEQASAAQPALAATPSTFTWWKSADGQNWRAYVDGPPDTSGKATEIQLLTALQGASHGVSGNYHYIVETDIATAAEEEFNAWYNTEHLPGLSRVPGTVRAQRYLRLSSSPRYIACYELLSPAVMESPAWLAIRHTAWSARIRPMFMNTVRQLFIRHTP
ncbi:hypothetical protein ACHEXK_15215 [Limnohabitans sp. DCL3]|jgi:hypothetical protein|uniref:hypothetical protein n=1 Tax=Limnohabitans sp. DCL3 TaxID=3374103 RepID=UPI003A88CA42